MDRQEKGGNNNLGTCNNTKGGTGKGRVRKLKETRIVGENRKREKWIGEQKISWTH